MQTGQGVQLVAQLLAAVLTGGGTYRVAAWIFDYLATAGVYLTKVQKRVLVLPVCAAIAAIALTAEVLLGLVPLTPDAALVALMAGFTASQMFQLQDATTTTARE